MPGHPFANVENRRCTEIRLDSKASRSRIERVEKGDVKQYIWGGLKSNNAALQTDRDSLGPVTRT